MTPLDDYVSTCRRHELWRLATVVTIGLGLAQSACKSAM
jgi:hypothetical protein